MKKITLLICMIILFTGFSAISSFAQDAPPTNFVVFEEFVSPSDLNEFVDAQNRAFELWEKYEMSLPVYCYWTDDNSYYWVVPIENFASMDKLFEYTSELSKKMKEDGYDADKEFRGLSTGRQTMIHWSDKLSYRPSGSYGQSPDKPYVEWTFCYLVAGHEKEAGAAINKYIEFYEGVDESFEWDLYQVMMGHDTPAWIIMVRAESKLALTKLHSELQEKYGDKFREMWAEFASHVRKFERKSGQFLPKWSWNTVQPE